MASLFNRVLLSFKKMPGIGERLAEKLTFHILEINENDLKEFLNSIAEFKNKIQNCSICGLISEQDPCKICTSVKRERDKICIVKNIQDALKIERSGAYYGLYHVLKGLVSPVDGISENDLTIKELITRIKKNPNIKELIFAFDDTIEGEATSQIIKNNLATIKNIQTTKLSSGIPYGTDIENIDPETIKKSLIDRKSF